MKKLLGVACGVSLCALVGMSCGELGAGANEGPYLRPLDRDEAQTRQQEIRPTQGDGFLGNGYGDGVEVDSFASTGGHVRVWWAKSGPDAPLATDANNDGVPDLVAAIAEVSDEVITELEDQGWRLPPKDVGAGFNDGDDGGDDRFDVYLKDMRAGDGQYIRERCFASGCAGYIVIENDFRGSSYASLEEAAKVLVSHEYFHAVQTAYQVDLEGWLSEGMATWHEESFYPEQSDFEHLANLYFKEHTRSLHDRNRGPSDAFQYGTSLFFYSVSLKHGPSAIERMLAELKTGEAQVLGVSRALDALGTSLEDELARFAVYNAFTGSRAAEQHTYPQAARFDEVALSALGTRSTFNWDVELDAMATRYAIFDSKVDVTVDWRAVREDGQPLPTLSVVSLRTYPQTGEVVRVAPGQPARLVAADAPYILVVSNADPKLTLAARAAVREAKAPEPEPEVDMGQDDMSSPDLGEAAPKPSTSADDGGCAASGAGRVGGALSWLALAVGLVGLRRLKRRKVERRC